MKRFKISLIQRNERGIASIDKVESDNLNEALSQFILVLGHMHDKLVEELRIKKIFEIDDDIPF